MKLNELFENTIVTVTDSSSADEFLSRMEKRKLADAYPIVRDRITSLKIQDEEEGGSSNIKDAINRLKKWMQAHPLRKQENPGGQSIYHHSPNRAY